MKCSRYFFAIRLRLEGELYLSSGWAQRYGREKGNERKKERERERVERRRIKAEKEGEEEEGGQWIKFLRPWGRHIRRHSSRPPPGGPANLSMEILHEGDAAPPRGSPRRRYQQHVTNFLSDFFDLKKEALPFDKKSQERFRMVHFTSYWVYYTNHRLCVLRFAWLNDRISIKYLSIEKT